MTHDDGRVVPLPGAGVFLTCAIHGIANCGNHSAAGKGAVVEYANSATEEEQVVRFQALKKVVGEVTAQKVADRSDEITFLAAQRRGVLTNLKQVSSNTVEQQHSQDLLIRNRAPAHATRQFI